MSETAGMGSQCADPKSGRSIPDKLQVVEDGHVLAEFTGEEVLEVRVIHAGGRLTWNFNAQTGRWTVDDS